MSVNSVNAANPVVQENKKGGGGKAFASAIIPGLGQFMDGRNRAGAAYLGTMAGAGIGINLLSGSIMKDAFTAASETTLNKQNAKAFGIFGLAIASFAVWIANIVDAYKGGKGKS